jgi:tetratricopeptide (TPR) repeat protein
MPGDELHSPATGHSAPAPGIEPVSGHRPVEEAAPPSRPVASLDGRLPAQGRILYGILLLATCVFVAAAAWLAKAFIDGTNGDRPDTAAAHYERGLEHFQATRWDRAIDEFDAAIRRDPENADYHHLKGIALAKKGDFREALGPIDKAIRLRPDLFGAHTNRAWVLRELGRYDDALGPANVVIDRLKPANVHRAKAYHQRGDIYRAKGEADTAFFLKAREDYRAAIRLDPSDSEASERNLADVERRISQSEAKNPKDAKQN